MSEVPYARLLGATPVPDAPGRLFMPFAEAVVGRPGFLHGGAIAGLLELAALAEARRRVGAEVRLKPVNIGIDYLRGGRALPTYAEAEMVRLGRTVASLSARAWQEDPAKPIATARLTLLLSSSKR